MKLETSTSKFPTPTAGGGSNKVKPRQPLRKARDGHCGELILILDNPMARGALARVSGLLLILAAAPAQAAGVCIVCPPGHTCPPGEAPVLGGTHGQILQRTSDGTVWREVNHAIFAMPGGITGVIATMDDLERIGARADANLPTDMRCTLRRLSVSTGNILGICHNSSTSAPTGYESQWGIDQSTGRYCWCTTNSMHSDDLICPHPTPNFVRAFDNPQGCTGPNQGHCVQYCRRTINWRLPQAPGYQLNV